MDPQKEGILQYLREFRGAILVDSSRGKGFILTRNGDMQAAYFKDKEGNYRGAAAIRSLMAAAAGEAGTPHQNFVLRMYTEEEFAEALDLCTKGKLLIEPARANEEETPAEPSLPAEVSRHVPAFLDEEALQKIVRQPGVIAVSAFYEGFPVLSLGEGDFEHVAARAEDLMRAGTTIAEDMNLGEPDQLILETAAYKLIIAPCGDLFLCIMTHADAQLGLIRVFLKSIQTGTGT